MCRPATPIFLSFALAWAEILGASDVFIGVNALDYSGYPDCRPEYIRAYEQMANLATKAGVEGTQRLKIHTPLIDLTKAQIIQRGLDSGRRLLPDAQLLRPRPGRPGLRHVRLLPAAPPRDSPNSVWTIRRSPRCRAGRHDVPRQRDLLHPAR